MNIQQNISLRPYNTFGIDERAAYFVTLDDESDLPALAALPHTKHVLGGGSNILLTGPVDGIVVHNRLSGTRIIKEDNEHVWLEAAAGENWHEFVLYAINKGWNGIENLALIPGTVGASPMQNIGAYGAEARQTIESVTFWFWEEKTFVTYANEQCQFGYRDSIFKKELKDKAFITSVVYKLSKQPHYNISYGAIAQELEKMQVQELSAKAIANAVISIRSSKLPDPKVTGNAGSFFKNPTIPRLQYASLQCKYAEIPSYPVDDKMVKVPAGWLIEQCGWKGCRRGDTGVHPKQALVLVNYGYAAGNDIWKLSSEIVASVKEKFDIALEREVQLW